MHFLFLLFGKSLGSTTFWRIHYYACTAVCWHSAAALPLTASHTAYSLGAMPCCIQLEEAAL